MRAALIAVASMLVVAPTAAFAQAGPEQPDGQGTDMFVTIAARECNDYSDIRANLARNNLQESLQDLGQDTLYTSGEPINPVKERRGQPTCRPITGWQFTLGSGIAGQAVTGVWGSLSIVTGADDQAIQTLASTPLRDWQGIAVAGVSIPGAVTIELTDAQLSRSAGNALWLQGGTTTDPVLYGLPQFAGKYGFGALRCGIDDLNGDNVETIQFPAGTRHAFCYAYYVTPPPSSGTIVIRKQVEGGDATTETFPFSGNVSYNEGGAFELRAGPGSPGQETFYRAETRPGDDPWTAIEAPPPGWTLTDISCTSAASQTTTSIASGRAEIRLAAGDTVTCTYTNRLTPPVGALLIRKITEDGTGTFSFRVAGQGGDIFARPRATTKLEGVAAIARPGPAKLAPGRYRINETQPRTKAGVWRLRGVSCNGTAKPADEPVEVEVAAGGGTICTFTNRLDRPGRIDITKITRGGTGKAAFVISPLGDPTIQRRQFATTKATGRPAHAHGQSTHGIPFGRYVIQESAADPDQRGQWALIAVVCDRKLVPFEQGRAIVSVTRDNPDVDCTFINQRHPQPAPPGPSPDPPNPTPEPGGDEPDLVLTKTVKTPGTGPTPRVVFEIDVTNRGPATATQVVVGDNLPNGMRLVSAHPSQGSCTQTRLVVCQLGDIAPRDRATVTVTAIRYDQAATTNLAALGSGSPDARTSNNRDRARFAPRRAVGGVCATPSQTARPAC